MKYHHIFSLIWICLLLTKCQEKVTQITFSGPIEIQLELGQHYEELVPKYFVSSQRAVLSNLVHEDNKIDLDQLNSQIFTLETKQEETLVRENEVYNYGLSDPDEYFSGDKKICRFADLKKLIGVLDVVEFNHEVIVLFQSGYYSFYTLEGQNKELSLKQTRRFLSNITNITSFDRLSYSPAAMNFWGNFVKSEDGQRLIFIGEEKAFLFNKEKREFQLLQHEVALPGANFEKAIILGDQLIIAAGQKGILVFNINFDKMELKYTRYYKPSIFKNKETSKEMVELSPIEIAYDYKLKKVAVIDEFQGIYWVELLEELGNVVLYCDEKAVFVENCQNIQIVQEANVAIAFCPNFMVINLDSREHTFIEEMDFVPTEITVNSGKVYMFSRHQFAIYDLISKTLEQGVTGYEIDFSIIVDQSILTVNRFYIAKNKILPEIKTFYIGMDQQDNSQFIGANFISIVLEGKCSDLISQEQILKLNAGGITKSRLYNLNQHEISLFNMSRKSEGKCQITQSLVIQVVDSSKPSHVLEIILSSVIAALLILLGLFYWNENRHIKKTYSALLQQEKVVKVQETVQSAYTLNPEAKNDL